MNDTMKRPIRRVLATAFALSALLVVAASMAPTLRADAASDEVLHAEQSRTTALIAGDFDTLNKVMADDVTYVHASGQHDTKQTYLAALHSGVLSYQSWTAQEIHVRMLGPGVAVLNGIYNVHAMDHRVGNDEIIIDIHFLTVYVRRDNRWQQVAWQSTRVPAPAPAAAATPSN
jgi:uncharacterized protein (TIGR02246 family)